MEIMAEAEPTLDQNPSSRIATEFSVTDCSICLEQLRKPKSLPCLHTFCQDCLSTFITSNNTSENIPVFFNCPVCRRKTLPIEPSSSQDFWASQFPTNNFVVEMMKKSNSEATSKHLCQPCQKRENKETPASCWCQDCGHFQCENCNVGHNLILFDHKTISVEELSQRCIGPIPAQTKCEKHGKNIEFICLDHTVLCCYVCIAIDHRKCDNVSTVIEHAENLKSTEKLTELSQDIDKNVSGIDCVIAEFRKKLDIVTQDKDTALQRLSDVREWFDSQMSKMSNDLIKTYKVESERIQRTLEEMRTVRTSLLQTKAISNTSQQNCNEHQLVSTVLRAKLEIERCEQIFQNKTDENVRICLKFIDEIDNSTKEKKYIGTVEVRSKQTTNSNPFFGRAAKQTGTITVPGSGEYIRGILVLSSGQLLVSDYYGKQLLLITESGDVLSTLKLDGCPWDICQMPDGDIAVSVYSKKKISIVRLSSSQLSLIRTIQLTEPPRGIIFYDGALHVTTDTNRLHRVSDSDKLQQLQKFNTHGYYLTCSKNDCQLVGSLCGNNEANSAVYRVSRDNTNTEAIKTDIVKGAYGIDVDDEDNIYVCGNTSNNVLQISADGTKTRELLTSQDVSYPFLLVIRGNEMYISENLTRTIQIYQLE